jgi:hypothetical protein
VAREVNNISKTYDSMEPQSAYRARYPFNKVLRTEGGHVVEIDDTPGSERIHIFHKSGTYSEIDNTGRKVDKVVGDSFEITLGNKTVHINGNVNILVEGTYTLESKGNMTLKAPRIDLNP